MPENNGAAAQQGKSVGAVLREAREAKNLSLEQVSRTTRIHAHVLKALEEDDTGKLGVVYTKSFLRLYAEFLGLDKEEMVARFAAATPDEAMPVKKIIVSASGGPGPRGPAGPGGRLWGQLCRQVRRVPWQRVAIGALVIVFIFGMGRWVKGCRARAREKRAAAAAQPAPRPARAAKTAPPQPAASKAVSKPPVKKTEEQSVVLVVRAVDKTWLQVKADGAIIFQSVLSKGSSERWQAREKIELSIGDAGALELEVNGRFLDRIGRPGQTLKDVVITLKGLAVRG